MEGKMVDEFRLGGLRMMKSDELGAIFVNEVGRSKFGQSNTRIFGEGKSEI